MAAQLSFLEPLPRKKREWMMHVTDAGDHGDTALVELTCRRCGRCTGWVKSRTVTEEKRGRPCPTCNGLTPSS